MAVAKKNFDEVIEYLDLVEEYKGESRLSLFEKVKVASARAKDLYAGKTSKLSSSLDGGKPISIAQYELVKGMIEPEITEKEITTDEFGDDLDFD